MIKDRRRTASNSVSVTDLAERATMPNGILPERLPPEANFFHRSSLMS